MLCCNSTKHSKRCAAAIASIWGREGGGVGKDLSEFKNFVNYFTIYELEDNCSE